MLTFFCDGCGSLLRAPLDYAGRSVVCPGCQTAVHIRRSVEHREIELEPEHEPGPVAPGASPHTAASAVRLASQGCPSPNAGVGGAGVRNVGVQEDVDSAFRLTRFQLADLRRTERHRSKLRAASATYRILGFGFALAAMAMLVHVAYSFGMNTTKFGVSGAGLLATLVLAGLSQVAFKAAEATLCCEPWAPLFFSLFCGFATLGAGFAGMVAIARLGLPGLGALLLGALPPVLILAISLRARTALHEFGRCPAWAREALHEAGL